MYDLANRNIEIVRVLVYGAFIVGTFKKSNSFQSINFTLKKIKSR